MRTILKLTAAVLAAVVLFLLATLPPAPVAAGPGDPALANRTVAGAFHVHTTRSDGAADTAAVARAAARAGLRFVVFTDHGDGTRPPDPPAYVDGVLSVDGVEISTNGGHYVAVGHLPAPYPLGGEAAAVVEDVRRLGGFGVAAHPASSRADLAWTDWSAPIDAVEWLNADSEWRDEPRMRLTRAFVDYLIRPPAALASLLDRPVAALGRWDAAASRRRVLALAGHDAHGGIGGRSEYGQGGRRIGIPSYEASFRAFSIRAVLERPLSGDAAQDAAALLSALRAGRLFTSIDAVAAPAWLEFTARDSAGEVPQGAELAGEGPIALSARAAAPAGARTVLLHDGRTIAQADGGVLNAEAGEPGAYRVEVLVPGAPGDPPIPWLVSNPIFRHPRRQAGPPQTVVPVLPLGAPAWRIEKDAASSATVGADAGSVRVEYRLAPGARVSQFVALVTDLPAPLPPFDRIQFAGRASRPMRVSVQLRFPGGGARLMCSVYLDPNDRTIEVPTDSLVPAERESGRPDPRQAASLLFVVELTNARPGTAGSFWVRRPALAQAAAAVVH